jgi:hypothetical protein
MRAIDCGEGHDEIHMTGETDDELFEQLKQHRDQYHPELTDDQVRGAIAAGAYDE